MVDDVVEDAVVVFLNSFPGIALFCNIVSDVADADKLLIGGTNSLFLDAPFSDAPIITFEVCMPWLDALLLCSKGFDDLFRAFSFPPSFGLRCRVDTAAGPIANIGWEYALFWLGKVQWLSWILPPM